jgi:hypothetical protein
MVNIHKKGSKDECKNYRRIDLLVTASKLYANILKNRLMPTVEGILGEAQCGFRKGHSCVDAAYTLKLLMEK